MLLDEGRAKEAVSNAITCASSHLKRLEALEQRRCKDGPVALFPRLVSVDEWGELASQMQAILKENVKKDTAPDYGNLPKLELVVSQ